MHRFRSMPWLVATAAAALTLAAAQPSAAQVPGNSLPLPPGYSEGAAVAVNAGGQVAGLVMDADGGRSACVWKSDGTPVVLPLLDGCGGAAANAINDSGVVVGYCESATDTSLWRATSWTPNADGGYTATDLGVLDGQTGSSAVAINAQGQILCDNGYYGSTPYFLWEGGVSTKVALPDGTPIDAHGIGLLGASGLLSSDGRVAGTVYWDIESEGVVLWQKTSTGDIVITKITGGPEDTAQAISRNGVVGYAHWDALYLYDANTATTTPVDSTPWTSEDGSITYFPYWIESVNDLGQAVVGVVAEDSTTGAAALLPFVWQSGNWTPIPVGGLLPVGSELFEAIGVINNSGQVAGLAMAYTGPYAVVGFGWSASTGMVQLAPPSGTDLGGALALNDSGLAVGIGQSTVTGNVLPAVWDLTAPPALTISGVTVTVPNPKSPNITVTVTITNPSTTATAYDVTVNAASLGGVGTKSVLPLLYGAIKPGASKQCKLQFKGISPGPQTLRVRGTSSLGDFFTTQTVTVP